MSPLKVVVCASQPEVPKLKFFLQRVHLDEFQEKDVVTIQKDKSLIVSGFLIHGLL